MPSDTLAPVTTVPPSPPSFAPAPNGRSAEAELISEQRDARRVIMRTAVLASVLGLLLFVTLELVASFPNVAAALSVPPKKMPQAWEFNAGIDNADAAVIVTALLLLVATMNVALAALLIKDNDTITGSVRAFTWARIAAGAGSVAAVISVALSLTRIATSPPLFVVLSFVTLLTIVLTGSIEPREELPQLQLRKADLERKLSTLKLGIQSLPDVARRTWVYVVQLGGILAICVLFSTGLALATTVALHPEAASVTTAPEWLGTIAYALLAVGPGYLLVYFFFIAIKVASLAVLARGLRGIARLVSVGYWAAVAGMAALTIPTQRHWGVLEWLIILELIVVPPVLIAVLAHKGPAEAPSLRRALLRFASITLRLRLRDVEREAASNSDALALAMSNRRPRRPPRMRRGRSRSVQVGRSTRRRYQ